MSVCQIVKIGDDILREKAQEVRRFSPLLHKMLDDMADTMERYNGVGLAAPQIGISKRVVVINVGTGLLELVNPVIIERSGEITDEEGCLSVPGETGLVTRSSFVKIEAQDRDGKKFTLSAGGLDEADDLLCRCIQHELDHLEGVLFVDKMEKETGRKRK